MSHAQNTEHRTHHNELPQNFKTRFSTEAPAAVGSTNRENLAAILRGS